MPPLPLASTLLRSLPWLSPHGKAVINLLICDNGRVRSAGALATSLGLRNRFQLSRLLRREGLPPFDILTGWVSVLYWSLEASRTGTSLAALSERCRVDRATSYRMVRRLTGAPWSKVRRLGTSDLLPEFLALCQDRPRRRQARRPQNVRTVRSDPPAKPLGQGKLPARLPLAGGPFSVAIHGDRLAYITRVHAATVECLDLVTLRSVGTIPVGCVPSCVAFDKTGTSAYVSIQYDSAIAVIDRATHERVAAIPVPGDPFPVLPARDGASLYFTTNEDRLYKLSLRTHRLVAAVSLPATSHFLALHPDGTRLYVSTRSGGTVMELETERHRVTRTFPLGGQPQGLALSSDGRWLYVANEHQGLNVVWLPTGQVVRTLRMDGGPVHLALSPDNRTIYLGCVRAGTVAVVDCASLVERATLHTGGRPRGVALAGRGGMVVSANEAGWVDLLPAPAPSGSARRMTFRAPALAS